MSETLQKARKRFSKPDRATRSGAVNLSPDRSPLTDGDMEATGLAYNDMVEWGIPIGLTGLDGDHRIIPGQLWQGPGNTLLRIKEVMGVRPANVVAEYVGGSSDEAVGAQYVERLQGFTRDRQLVVEVNEVQVIPGQLWRTPGGTTVKVMKLHVHIEALVTCKVIWCVSVPTAPGMRTTNPLKGFTEDNALIAQPHEADAIIKALKTPVSNGGSYPQVGEVWKYRNGVQLQVTGVADKKVICVYYSDRKSDGSYSKGVCSFEVSLDRFTKGRAITLEIPV